MNDLALSIPTFETAANYPYNGSDQHYAYMYPKIPKEDYIKPFYYQNEIGNYTLKCNSNALIIKNFDSSVFNVN